MSGTPKIRIKVPDIYRKVSTNVWDELETYIFRCFLTASANFSGIDFVFKTLNHHEVMNIAYHRPITGSSEEVQRRYHATFISYSIFMMDGENVLLERTKNMRRLVKIFEKFDNTALEKIISNLSHLNKRASFLFPLTEVYIHENQSRSRWLQTKQVTVNTPSVTGIVGSDTIGMNYCQQVWTSLNQLQDLKDEIERDWNHSKFVGSCFNGKGVRPIEERDRGRREKERQEHDELKMKVLYRYLNRDDKGNSIDPEDVMTLPDGRRVKVESRKSSQTVDELADELSASLSGEKDAHDIAIEKALTQIRKKRDEAESEKMNIYKAPYLDDSDSISSVLSGKDEADNRIMRIRRLQFMQSQQSILRMNPEINDGSSIEPDK